jgi:hypothetical protein
MPKQKTRPFPRPWKVEAIEGSYVVKDPSGQSHAYVYGRETESMLIRLRSRRVASNIAKLPELLGKV